MKYTNIFEKMQCLIKIISNSVIYQVFLVILMVLLLLLLINKVVKRKKVIMLMIISYLLLFITVIATNYNALSKVFDSISTHLFTDIYFPSVNVYFFILVVVDIVMAMSIIDIRIDKAYKIVNGVSFFTQQFILAIIMDIVAHNKIDIFTKKSLFSNTDVVVMLEFSVLVFIVWLLALAVVYISDKVTIRAILKQEDRNSSKDEVIAKQEVLEEAIPNSAEPVVAVSKPQYSYNFDENKDNLNNNSFVYKARGNNQGMEANASVNGNNPVDKQALNTRFVSNVKANDASVEVPNVMPIEEPSFKIDEFIPNNDKLVNLGEREVSANAMLDRLLNNELPLIHENKTLEVNKEDSIVEGCEVNNKKDEYTLNDYKIFNKILKDIKRHNDGNVINIDRSLEIRLLMKYPKEEYDLFKGMLKNYSN